MFRLSSSVDVGRHRQETVQLRSGIQRIVMETLRMNQGLYLSKLGGLLFSLSNSAELCPIRGHAPSAAGARGWLPAEVLGPGWASWCPRSARFGVSQVRGPGLTEEDPGLDLCSGPRKGRCCLHDVRLLSSHV